MTTLDNRPNTALLVVDVQNGVVDGAHERDAVVANIASLVEQGAARTGPRGVGAAPQRRARAGKRRLADRPRAGPGEAEPLVEKKYGDSFEDTDPGERAGGPRRRALVVVGAQTDACVRSTLHGAFARGYDATLVSDAHTTEDMTQYGAPPPDKVIAHTNLYWKYQTAPGRTAGTVATSDVTSTPAPSLGSTPPF